VHSFSTCRPLGPRGVHRLRLLSSFTDDIGLRPESQGSALPKFPSSVSDGGWFRGYTGSLLATACRVACPLTDLTGNFAQPTGTFTPELPTSRSPFSSSGITTVATERFHRWDFHPLERQLASLHGLFPSLQHAGSSRRTRIHAVTGEVGAKRLVRYETYPPLADSNPICLRKHRHILKYADDSFVYTGR